MNSFSISQLEQLSGIKAHTIRVWEQRYHALSPLRSEGNTRYYDGQQLRRLLNIVSLLGQDYKVSEICAMSDAELQEILNGHLSSKITNEYGDHFVSQLISASMTFDEVHFDKIFSSCLLRFGMQNMYMTIIHPMLVRIGLMWGSDTIAPAQEHFISNLLRKKFFSALDTLPPPRSTNQTWLLFLPEDEFHEIGLLFSHFIISQAGHKVVYLGANLPQDAVVKSITQINPTHLLFFFVQHDLRENRQSYVDLLSQNFPDLKLCIAGKPTVLDDLVLGRFSLKMHSVTELENELTV